jgi:hypothetical protein
VRERVNWASDGQPLADVLLDELELRQVHQLSDVIQSTSGEIVYTYDLVPPAQKSLAEVRTQEARTPGHDDTHDSP